MRSWRLLFVGMVAGLAFFGSRPLYGQTLPAFLSQPRKLARAGEVYRAVLRAWTPDRPQGSLRWVLKKPSPAGTMRLIEMGQERRGIGRALLLWRPTTSELLQETPVEIEVFDPHQPTLRATQSFSIQGLVPNQPPTIAPLSSALRETTVGTAYQAQLTIQDPDDARSDLIVEKVEAPAEMTLDQTGLLRWTPRLEDVGPHPVTLRVLDTKGGIATSTFVITVTGAKEPPKITSLPPKGAALGIPYIYTMAASDPNPEDAITWRLLRGPSGMQIHPTGLLYWIPSLGQASTTVEVEARDTSGLPTTQTWSLSVVPSNQPPVLRSYPSLSAEEGQAYTYLLEASDPDNDPLTFQGERLPAGMTLTPKGPTQALLEWTPLASHSSQGPHSPQGSHALQGGLHPVVIRVDDGKGGLVWDRFTLHVPKKPHPPVFRGKPLSVAHTGLLYRERLQARDPDGDRVTFSARQMPAGMTLDETTGWLEWLPSPTDGGLHPVEILANDSEGQKATLRFFLRVFLTPRPPVITSQPPTTRLFQGETFVYTFKASDLDQTSEAVEIRLIEGPPRMQIHPSSGEIRWTAEKADIGVWPVSVEATSKQGKRSLQTWLLTVERRNDPPQFVQHLWKPMTGATIQQEYSYPVHATDPDGDPIRFTLLQSPEGMEIDQAGLLRWTPKPSQKGTSSIRLSISDPSGASSERSFSILVAEANQPPTLPIAQIRSLQEIRKEAGQTLEIQLPEATDPDQDSLFCTLEEGSEEIQIQADSTTSKGRLRCSLRWSIPPWLRGFHRLTVRIYDGKGGAFRIPIVVEVTAPTTPEKASFPAIQSEPPLFAYAETPYLYALRVFDPDPTADPALFLYEVVQGASLGIAFEAKTAYLRWNPPASLIGQWVDVTIRVKKTVSSGQTIASEQAFWIYVASGPKPPEIPTILWPKASQDLPWFFSLPSSALPQGLASRFFLLEAPEGLDLDERSGLLRWKPLAKDVGLRPLRWGVVDAEGRTLLQDNVLEVEDRNDPPQITASCPHVASVGQLWRCELRASDLLDPKPDAPLLFRLLASPSQMPPSAFEPNLPVPQIAWSLPPGAAAGLRLIVWEVEDQRQGKAAQAILLSLASPSAPPVWKKIPLQSPSALLLTAGETWQETLSAADPEGKELSWRLLEAPQGLLLHPRNGDLLWTPSLSQVGSHPLFLEVSNSTGASIQARFLLDVRKKKNLPPQIVSQPETWVAAKMRFSYSVKAVDPDGSATSLVFSLAQAPQGMQIDAKTGLVTWTPGPTQAGRWFVKIVATDADGESGQQSFGLRVEETPASWVIRSPSLLSATEGERWLVLIETTAPSEIKERLLYHLLQGPAGMTLSSTGWLSWEPTALDVLRRQAQIQIQVVDPLGLNPKETFTLTLHDKNSPPRFLSVGCPEATAGKPYNCVLKIADQDLPLRPDLGIAFRFALRQGPSGLSLPSEILATLASDGTTQASLLLQWEQPRLTDVGDHLVVLEVKDEQGATDLLRFSLRVLTQQDGPIADPGPELLGLAPGEISLDASRSRYVGATEGQPLTYLWECKQSPDETKVEIPEPQSKKPKVILRKAGEYLFQLTVRSGDLESKPAFLRVTIRNIPPYAALPAALQIVEEEKLLKREIYHLTGHVGQEVVLDASESADLNADLLRFQWSWLSPTADTPALLDAETAKARFLPKKAGVLRLQLLVQDRPADPSQALSHTVEVEIAIHDPSSQPPLFLPFAQIYSPKTAAIQEVVALDGSRSLSLSGPISEFAWSLLRASEGTRLEVDPKVPSKATLVSEDVGFVQVGLRVRNSVGWSRQTVVGIALEGKEERLRLPVARASSSHAPVGTWFSMDASSSVDPIGGQLSFTWLQIGGVKVELLEARTSRPSFFVLHPGPYRFRLWVQGRTTGQVLAPESAPVDLEISGNPTTNQPPQAEAGPPLSGPTSIRAGIALPEGKIDASKSSDPEGQPLSYRWLQVDGFPTWLPRSSSPTLSFLPVTSGVYTFSLRVSDGASWSLPTLLHVAVNDASNSIPHADPGPDREIRLGENVRLDGSRSSDADPKDTLSFTWRLVEPPGLWLPLNLADPLHPTFLAQNTKVSRYVFGLQVDDGKASSIESLVSIRVLGLNLPPIASIRPVGTFAVGELVALDGSASSDPDGDPLRWAWSQIAGPSIQTERWDTSALRFSAPKEGVYTFRLQVQDDKQALSPPADISFQVGPRGSLPLGCSCSQTAFVPSFSPLFLWLFGLFVLRRRGRRDTP